MKRQLIVITSLLLLITVSGCMYAIRYDGTYFGKVVEQDMREPIVGAVVLGTWSVLHPNVAGGYNTYYDAREAVTDRHGEFSIPGQGLRIMSNLELMSVLIFKAGYSYERVSWDSLKTGMYSKDRIIWEGDKPIFPLKKLSIDERKKQHADKETIPDKNQRLLIKELNKEYRELGISLYP
jgi:hypothetical protein